MSAQCVSRTFVALAVALALTLVPASGVCAAPNAQTGGTDGWLAGVHQWLADWTETVLEAVRFGPGGERGTELPDGAMAPDDGETLRHVEGEDGYKIDPDG